MSFATALMLGLGGYGRARQQQFEDTQQVAARTDAQRQAAQAEADRQRELALQEQRGTQEAQAFKESEEDRQRNRGIDPATGKPFVMPLPLSQVRPNNKGRGGAPTLQDLYNHQTALAGYYTTTGQTDRANLASMQAAETARQLAAQQSQQASFARMSYEQQIKILLDQYNQTHEDDREQRSESSQARIHALPTYRDLHAPPGTGRGPKVTPEQASQAQAQWYTKWEAATKPRSTGGMFPSPAPALIPADKQAAASHLFSIVDNAADPIAKADELTHDRRVTNPTLKALLIERGRAAQMKKTAADGGYIGGSQDTPPFPE